LHSWTRTGHPLLHLQLRQLQQQHPLHNNNKLVLVDAEVPHLVVADTTSVEALHPLLLPPQLMTNQLQNQNQGDSMASAKKAVEEDAVVVVTVVAVAVHLTSTVKLVKPTLTKKSTILGVAMTAKQNERWRKPLQMTLW
jgi:hypothetical protein